MYPPFLLIYLLDKVFLTLLADFIFCNLEINNFVGAFDNIQTHSLSKIQFMKQFHKWFDNLKIYKFLKLYENQD